MSFYTARALAAKVGLSYRQVEYWTAQGYLVPEEVEGRPSKGIGNPRIYSEQTMVKAALMRQMTTIAEASRLADLLLDRGVTSFDMLLPPPPPPRTVQPRLIDSLNLSVRSYNVLKREGVNTVTELLAAYDDGTLLGFRNLGEKSLAEITEHVERLRGTAEYPYVLTEGEVR